MRGRIHIIQQILLIVVLFLSGFKTQHLTGYQVCLDGIAFVQQIISENSDF